MITTCQKAFAIVFIVFAVSAHVNAGEPQPNENHSQIRQDLRTLFDNHRRIGEESTQRQREKLDALDQEYTKNSPPWFMPLVSHVIKWTVAMSPNLLLMCAGPDSMSWWISGALSLGCLAFEKWAY